ncbi:MAG: hypothetical protein E4G93_04940 [Dehalococcoidia bacterium]|nr:MAG: hypothetical protein E4G93_04940 [Dehalococcoidia bacterium]
MTNAVSSSRKDIAVRCAPAIAGMVCMVVAARMTSPSESTFALLVIEGVALIGLAVFLVRRYLKTPAE